MNRNILTIRASAEAQSRFHEIFPERTFVHSIAPALEPGGFTALWDLEPNVVLELLRARGAETPQAGVVLLFFSVGNLAQYGELLQQAATDELLYGIRLIATEEFLDRDTKTSWTDLFEFRPGKNVLRMPIAPEIADSPLKEFYVFSPSMHELVDTLDAFAKNGVERIFLIGAPGAGKTSLSYRYFLTRGKGNFVTVNLSAENTGDKGSMKSLLCGHVTGAIPGAPAREGAFSYARDGVCFLDETHSAPGAVMQVLMEVLESGQFLPFGATAKRKLDSALVFATNRSWSALRSSLHLDEHARLGATMVTVPDLRLRMEDALGVTATLFARFTRQAKTWAAPCGLSAESWRLLCASPWRGNTRTLIRVIETACIEYGRRSMRQVPSASVLEAQDTLLALQLWEPEAHPDDGLYVSSENAYG